MAFTKIVPAGINTGGSYTLQDLNVVGVLTASSFSGPLTGDATGLTGTPDVTVGAITAASADFSGNVSIAGTLTYEDVTNIDSVGLITARSGINVSGGVVDIGTETGGRKTLTLNSSDNGAAVVFRANAATRARIEVPDGQTDLIFGVETAVTPSERLRITSTGWQQSHADWQNGVGINTFASWARDGGAIRAEIGYNAVTTDYMYFGTGTVHPLALRVQNNNALYINTSGQIGIGTDNPSRSLDICFDSESGIELRNNTANKNLQFLVKDDGTGRIVQPSDRSLQFDRAGTVSAVITSSGNIGIGTDNPGRLLNLYGATTPLVRLTHTTASSYAGLEVYEGTTQKAAFNALGSTSTANGGANAIQVWNFMNAPTVFGTNNTERLRITSAGRMGVGTNDPNALLEVRDSENTTQGDAQIRISKGVGAAAAPATITRANTYLHLGGTEWGSGANGKYLIGLGYTNDEVGTGIPAYMGFTETSVSGYTQGDLIFGTRGNTIGTDNPTERLRITSDGDLKSANINISGYSNTHNIDNYSVFLSDNHANTFFGQNLRLDFSGTSGNHQLKVINQHATIGGAGMLIGGNGSPYVNQIKFYTVAANQPAGTRVDDTAARMTIDTNGYVTKPNNPSFAVNWDGSMINVSANSQMQFDQVLHNIGSHYSTSTYRFTAPVSGTYQFNFWSIWYAQTIVNAALYLYVNNARIYGGDIHFSADFSSGKWHNVSYSAAVYLNSGDYVYLQNGSVAISYHGDNWSRFSGYLVG